MTFYFSSCIYMKRNVCIGWHPLKMQHLQPTPNKRQYDIARSRGRELEAALRPVAKRSHTSHRLSSHCHSTSTRTHTVTRPRYQQRTALPPCKDISYNMELDVGCYLAPPILTMVVSILWSEKNVQIFVHLFWKLKGSSHEIRTTDC